MLLQLELKYVSPNHKLFKNSSTNKSHLRVVDDGQIQSVAKSLRESTNGTIVGSCNTKAVDSIFFVFWLTALFILTDYMPFTWNLNVPHFITMFS